MELFISFSRNMSFVWVHLCKNTLMNSVIDDTYKSRLRIHASHHIDDQRLLLVFLDENFVTGSYLGDNGRAFSGLETEILDYASGTWVQVEDYPFSENDRYVLF